MNASAQAVGVSREDIVLAIAAGAAGPYDLDPIRLMKGCFIVSQRGRKEWRELFDFEPYDYGPFDRGVYAARDALVARGLLAEDDSSRYPSYELTEEGKRRVEEIEELLGEKDTTWLARIGDWVTSKTFSKLLDDVYAAFPDYAVRSLHR